MRAVLGRHSFAAAEKFIQEVCWRTYWKGWLEHHPAVWDEFLEGVGHEHAALLRAGREEDLDAVQAGRTGIPCFDAWVHELIETGYLHNHARMWFASIWIFTLRLPWVLGAAFFYRHLLDGDPASNTLSWRWVGGLQTRGKTYLARSDNIATWTAGRFPATAGLALSAPPLEGPPPPAPQPIAPADRLTGSGPLVLLMTDDDLDACSWGIAVDQVAAACMVPSVEPLSLSSAVRRFRDSVRADAMNRAERHFQCPGLTMATNDGYETIIGLARAKGATIVTMGPPVGPGRATLARADTAFSEARIQRIGLRRPWDEAFWRHAHKGFFHLKERIPQVLSQLRITSDGSVANRQGELFP